MASLVKGRQVRRLSVFVFVLLVIEFLDEFVFGARETAWPLIRDDLGLSYVQVGLLLSLPDLFASAVEPVIGILGDIWRRKVLVLGGGVLFIAALMLVAGSTGFWMLLFASFLLYPASGAFVALSQSTLMDLDPARHEQNMARWTLAGSIGVVGGSLAITLFLNIGLGWRDLFLFQAALMLVVLTVAWRFPFRNGSSGAGASYEDAHEEEEEEETPLSFREGLRGAFRALRRKEVLRWLTLLEFSDLMMDILYGYMALYFVDVVGVDGSQAALAVAVWTGVGLLGDMAMIPLLERVRGLDYLRYSVVIEFFLYIAFLLAPGFMPKVIIVALLGFFNAGWYSILAGKLYSSMPGQSGTVITVGNIFGLPATFLPLLIGAVAGRFGLDVAMWLLLAGPIVLWIGLPRE